MSGWLSGWSSESGGSQRQGQRQIQKKQTESLEQQVVFLDQLRKCFRLVDMHLENIVADESAEELDDSASSMVTGLNLVRMAVQDLKQDKNKKGMAAGKSELVKFIKKCENKYNDVESANRGKVIKVVDSVRHYVGCALSGGDVPVMEINGLDAESQNDSELANESMKYVMLGAHQEGDLRREVRANVRQYTEQVEEEAAIGAQYEKVLDLTFEESAQQALQEDMLGLTPFANETHEEAEASLRRMIAKRNAPVTFGDDEFPDDLDEPVVSSAASPAEPTEPIVEVEVSDSTCLTVGWMGNNRRVAANKGRWEELKDPETNENHQQFIPEVVTDDHLFEVVPRPFLYIRSTNVSGVANQGVRGNCYAQTAASAYINTTQRIYTGDLTVNRLDYADLLVTGDVGDGGRIDEAIRRIEEKYRRGVICESLGAVVPSLSDILCHTVALAFWTTKAGFEACKTNEGLVQEPYDFNDYVFPDDCTSGENPNVSGHAVLVEGYDFERKVYSCKNSWGDLADGGRFDFDPRGAHCRWFVIKVTRMSLSRSPLNYPDLRQFQVSEYFPGSSWRFLPAEVAYYSNKYYCRKLKDPQGLFTHIGLETASWVHVMCQLVDAIQRRDVRKERHARKYLLER